MNLSFSTRIERPHAGKQAPLEMFQSFLGEVQSSTNFEGINFEVLPQFSQKVPKWF